MVLLHQDAKARQEEKSRAALQQAAELLKEILQSSDPPNTLEQKLDEIDDAFFAVLSANIQEAQRQKQNQAAQTMELIGNMPEGIVPVSESGISTREEILKLWEAG